MTCIEALNRNMVKEVQRELACIERLCIQAQHSANNDCSELARNILSLLDAGVEV